MSGHIFRKGLRSLMPCNKRRRRLHPPRPPTPDEPPLRVLPMQRALGIASEYLPQLQSALISSLPAELRIKVWAYVLGPEMDDDVLHLDLADGILWHCRCFELLSLLVSCKLIYTEAAEFLYTENTFDVRRSAALLRLPQVIPSYHIKQIRSIRFSTALEATWFIPCTTSPPTHDIEDRISDVVTGWWRPPDRPRQWVAACGVLATLTSLEHLDITLAIWPLSPADRDLPVEDDSVVAMLEPRND